MLACGPDTRVNVVSSVRDNKLVTLPDHISDSKHEALAGGLRACTVISLGSGHSSVVQFVIPDKVEAHLDQFFDEALNTVLIFVI